MERSWVSGPMCSQEPANLLALQRTLSQWSHQRSINIVAFQVTCTRGMMPRIMVPWLGSFLWAQPCQLKVVAASNQPSLTNPRSAKKRAANSTRVNHNAASETCCLRLSCLEMHPRFDIDSFTNDVTADRDQQHNLRNRIPKRSEQNGGS